MDNRWRHGPVNFAFPHVPRSELVPGCKFLRLTVDPAVGEEVIAFLREVPPHAENIGRLRQVTTFARPGVMKTPYGVVGYIVWQIAIGTSEEVQYEQFLNPYEEGTYRLLDDVQRQDYLKLIILDITNREVTGFVEYENNFFLGTLNERMYDAIQEGERYAFAEACNHIAQNVSVEELLSNSYIRHVSV